MAKKYYCPVCGYESDEPIDVCPVCGAKMAVREEGETSWAAEHKVGIIDGVSEEIVNGLRENFQGECTEVGMYLAMARVAHREAILKSVFIGKRLLMKKQNTLQNLLNCWVTAYGIPRLTLKRE